MKRLLNYRYSKIRLTYQIVWHQVCACTWELPFLLLSTVDINKMSAGLVYYSNLA